MKTKGGEFPSWVKYPETGIIYVKIDGKWKSSGQTDHRKAQAWAKNWRLGGLSAGMTLEDFSVAFFLPGRCEYVASREDSDDRGARTKAYWAKSRAILENYLLPAWGAWPLEDVSAPEFYSWLSDLAGKRYGVKLSNKVRKLIRQTAVIVWDWAVFKGVLKYNRLLSVPKIAGRSVKRRAFRSHELATMFPPHLSIWPHGSVTSDLSPAWGVIFLILAETGMRPQEALALRWEDYRPEARAIIVSRAVGEDGLKGLKTAGHGVDRRAVPISTRLACILLSNNMVGKRSGPLFMRTDGDLLRVDTAGKVFCRVLDGVVRPPLEASVKVIDREGRTLYSLRHAYNTGTLTRAAKAEAQAAMGHTTDAMTANYDDPDEADLLARIGR